MDIYSGGISKEFTVGEEATSYLKFPIELMTAPKSNTLIKHVVDLYYSVITSIYRQLCTSYF